MIDLITALYKKLTTISVDGRSTHCACCGLTGSHVGPGRATKVKHMPDCELAILYAREGGAVEFRGESRL